MYFIFPGDFMIPEKVILWFWSSVFPLSFYDFTVSQQLRSLSRQRLLTSLCNNQALILSYEMCESLYPRTRSFAEISAKIE